VAREFSTIGIIGLGTMGTGIAEVVARTGLRVVAIEPDDAGLARGRGHLEHSTDRAVAGGKLTADQEKTLLDRATNGLDKLLNHQPKPKA